MKIYHVPIEPYETRYTADWIQQFENEFNKAGVEYETIYGTPVTKRIKDGCVLDACGTHIYKFSQLLCLMNKINMGEVKDGDIIFFCDLWFPGIESLFYVRNITKIDFKIVGILHAGTYDMHDFTYREGMRSWGKYVEASWMEGADQIFVATYFHKQLILQNQFLSVGDSLNSKLISKIKVTGIPFYAENLRDKYLSDEIKKENIIAFPHRLDIEKHPELLVSLENYLKNKHIDATIVKTMEVAKNREEYFNILARSKVMVSFAEQETFGYSTVESMALNNIVIVPNKLSYKETVPEDCRYDSLDECFAKVAAAIVNYKTPNYYLELAGWADSIPNMLNYAEEL